MFRLGGYILWKGLEVLWERLEMPFLGSNSHF